MPRPINPAGARAAFSAAIPDIFYEAFNELIVSCLDAS